MDGYNRMATINRMATNGRDVKNRLKEAMARIDDLETQIDSISKHKDLNDKQIQIQRNVIQELRKSRENAVDLCEYQNLREDFEKSHNELEKTEQKVKILSKKLLTDSTEIEILHKKCSQQTEQIHDLEKSLNECLHTIDSQNGVIVEINNYKENQEFYRKQYENTLLENSELKELLDIYKNEDTHGLNVSVEDLTQSMQSMSKFLDSVDCNANGETFDSVYDMKLADIQKALDEKKRLNDELILKTKQMNEEIDRLVRLRVEFEDSKRRETYSLEKQSFERLFQVVENHVLSRIPLNQYFVPFGRRVLFSLTPKCLLRALPK